MDQYDWMNEDIGLADAWEVLPQGWVRHFNPYLHFRDDETDSDVEYESESEEFVNQ